jgi:hypothetical protein
MCVTVTVVTSHSVALNRRSHLFSTMSSLHDVLVHDNVITFNCNFIQKKIDFYLGLNFLFEIFYLRF